MSLAWEVSGEDVAIVLKRHGVNESQMTRRALDLCRQGHAARIERAALTYDEMDEQASAALCEIEDVLMQAGVLSMPKRFAAR